MLALVGASDAPVFLADRADLKGHLEITERQWHEWGSAIFYDVPWKDTVRRSAFALRLLQYVPTGAVSAAPTTSLPEVIGGSKKWD